VTAYKLMRRHAAVRTPTGMDLTPTEKTRIAEATGVSKVSIG
jgi:hypothetical protein